MSLTSAFFDAELVGGVYDRVYSAERFAEYFAAFIANGVFPDPATNLQVVANVPRDMTVLVKSGLGWINGYYCNNDGNYPLTISPASGTLPRVDAVVLRWSRSNRSISLEVKTGVATSSPSAPSLERSADNYELMLASIEVVAGATSIAQANITDKRPDSSVCGWVKGVVDQVDTTDLFAQYDDAFQTWFDNIRAQLSGDIATNLQNQIDRNTANIAVINATTLKEDTKTALGLPISAGPDDAFKVLANVGNVHVWSKAQLKDTFVPVLGAAEALVFSYTTGGWLDNTVGLFYGNVDASSGEIILLNEQAPADIPGIAGLYYNKGGVVYFVSEVTGWSSGAKGTTVDFTGKKVSIGLAKVGDPAGFATSIDSTAYPRDGDVGDCHYTYLGQLGDKARIEVGSYVGTGVIADSRNPITIALTGEPYLFIVQHPGDYPIVEPWIKNTDGFSMTRGSTNIAYKFTVTTSGNTLTFYRYSLSSTGSDSAGYSLNARDVTYHYLALVK